MGEEIGSVPVSLVYSARNDLVVCLQEESGTGKSTTLAHLLMNDSQKVPHEILFMGDDPVTLISADKEILTYPEQPKGKYHSSEQTPVDCGAVVSFRGTQEDYDRKVAGVDLKSDIAHPYLLLEESPFEGLLGEPSWPVYLCCVPASHVYQFEDTLDIKPIGLVLNMHEQNGVQSTRPLTETDYMDSPFNPSDVRDRNFGSSVWLRRLYESRIPIIDVGVTGRRVDETIDQLSKLIREYQAQKAIQ